MTPTLFAKRMSTIIYAYLKSYVLFECQEEIMLKVALRSLVNNALYLRRTIALEHSEILESAEKLLNEANLTQELITEGKTRTLFRDFKQKVKNKKRCNRLSPAAKFMSDHENYLKLPVNYLECFATLNKIPFATASLFIRTANNLIDEYIKNTPETWKPFTLLGLKSSDDWDTFSIKDISPELSEDIKARAIEALENNQVKLYESINKYTLPDWIEKINQAFKEDNIPLPYIKDLQIHPVKKQKSITCRISRYDLDDYNERLEHAFDQHSGLMSITYVSEKNKLLKDHVFIKYKKKKCVVKEKGQISSLLYHFKETPDASTRLEYPKVTTIISWEEIETIIGAKPTRHGQNISEAIKTITKGIFPEDCDNTRSYSSIFKEKIFTEDSEVVKVTIDKSEIDLLSNAVGSCFSAINKRKNIAGIDWKDDRVTISCRKLEELKDVPGTRLDKSFTTMFFDRLKPYIDDMLIEDGIHNKCPVFKLIE